METLEELETDLCPSCNEQPAADLHICPFDQDVYDEEKYCTCCAECEQQCEEDI